LLSYLLHVPTTASGNSAGKAGSKRKTTKA